MMPATSFHTTHRRLLSLTESDRAVLDLVCQSSDEDRQLIDQYEWQRIWARIQDPDAGRIRIVLRADDHPTLHITVDVEGAPDTSDQTIRRVGRMWFPADRRLGTLASALNVFPASEVVRYRPGKRCTLRTADSLYVKVFADDPVERLHEEAVELFAASAKGILGFSVASAVGFDRGRRMQVQGAVEGEPIVDDLYGPAGTSLAYAVGHACGSIPASELVPSQTVSASDELERTRRRAGEVIRYVPELRAPVTKMLAELDRRHDLLRPTVPRPIHGSPHPNQWLSSRSRLGLVDFDRFGLGDPELDVATFAAEVDFEDGEQRDSVTSAFVEGYRDRYGSLDPLRLAVYRAHKRFAKVHRTVKAVRVDGHDRALVHLDQVLSVFNGSAAA